MKLHDRAVHTSSTSPDRPSHFTHNTQHGPQSSPAHQPSRQQGRTFSSARRVSQVHRYAQGAHAQGAPKWCRSASACPAAASAAKQHFPLNPRSGRDRARHRVHESTFPWQGVEYCHQAMLAPRSLPLSSGMPSASLIWPRTSWYRAQAVGGWEEGERVGRVLREGGAAARICVHILAAPFAAAQCIGTATQAAPGAPVPPCGVAVQLAKPARPWAAPSGHCRLTPPPPPAPATPHRHTPCARAHPHTFLHMPPPQLPTCEHHQVVAATGDREPNKRDDAAHMQVANGALVLQRGGNGARESEAAWAWRSAQREVSQG